MVVHFPRSFTIGPSNKFVNMQKEWQSKHKILIYGITHESDTVGKPLTLKIVTEQLFHKRQNPQDQTIKEVSDCGRLWWQWLDRVIEPVNHAMVKYTIKHTQTCQQNDNINLMKQLFCTEACNGQTATWRHWPRHREHVINTCCCWHLTSISKSFTTSSSWRWCWYVTFVILTK